jgi:DNA-binding response OmpR family regulator
MKLLIAHGDDTARLALKRVVAGLPGGDLEVIECGQGLEAFEMLLAADHPALALVDWDLPGCDGPELCRLVRAYHEAGPPYIILLARSVRRLAEGLEAGADDCVHTPAQGDELRARINVGRRFAALPWERVTQTAMGDEQCSPELDAQRSPELDAQRCADDDGLDGDHGALPGAKFELQSVLPAPRRAAQGG